MSVKARDYGDTRGVTVAALGFAGAFFALSLFLVFVLALFAPGDLDPLRLSDRDMWRFADSGHFPLIAAAVSLKLSALAFVANLQTFSFFALLAMATVYFARCGIISTRVRGWSNGVWIAGLLAICLLPSIFPDLTAQRLDYLLTAHVTGKIKTPIDAIYGAHGLNQMMLPSVFIVERALFGTFFVAAYAFVAHDLGYRMREALEDFGFIEVDEARRHGEPYADLHAGARRGQGGEGAGATFGGFGQRGAPHSAAPPSAEAQARAVLGVSASASRRDIERAYKAQIKRAHPDHGGSAERAAALNAARDALLRRG